MMTDLIHRMDAVLACQVGPSDEWSRDTKNGYAHAATDCTLNMLKINPAIPTPDPRDQVIARLVAALTEIITTNRLHGLTPNGAGKQVWFDGPSALIARSALAVAKEVLK